MTTTTIYKGEVVPGPDPNFPFIAIISDQDGNVVGEFPVRTEADGEAKIVEAIEELKRRINEEGSGAQGT